MIKFKTTEDGSATLYNSDIDECYHSIHGARAESMHIFIDKGLRYAEGKNKTIMEVGFGTGLNALLTAIEAKRMNIKVTYHTAELYPISEDIIDIIAKTVAKEEAELFKKIHASEWEYTVNITEHFCLHKHKADIREFAFEGIDADVVYFDAFSPEKQPELWTEAVFGNVYKGMKNGGALTTYCSKGVVRRTMQSVGFRVEKLEGPAHKRHITRAIKITRESV